jgi:hypothetical protein
MKIAQIIIEEQMIKSVDKKKGSRFFFMVIFLRQISHHFLKVIDSHLKEFPSRKQNILS